MEEISDVSEDHPSIIRGLFFIVTPEEVDLKFMVYSHVFMKKFKENRC